MIGMTTGIEWTDETWNPISGCSKVSEGCRNCYAERVSHRFGTTNKSWTNANAAENVQLHPERLDQPIRWRKPCKIFVNSMSDLFHEQVPDSFIDKVFAVMALAHQHEFQVFTKRPGRMKTYMKSARVRIGAAIEEIAPAYRGYEVFADDVATGACWPIPDIWLGVSVEDQRAAEERIPLLLQTPAAVRFLSCEPLLGAVHLGSYLHVHGRACYDDPGPCEGHPFLICDQHNELNWVIVGGESGPGARPMHPDWARSLRDQCAEAGIPFLFKQWGAWLPVEMTDKDFPATVARTCLAGDGKSGDVGHWLKAGKKAAGRSLDGRIWDEYPQEANVDD